MRILRVLVVLPCLAQAEPLHDVDDSGRAPFHVAIDSGRAPCVGLLVKPGLKRQARDRSGCTDFDAVDRVADRRLRAALLNVPAFPFRSKDGSNATEPQPGSLHHWVMRGDSDAAGGGW